MLISKAQEQSIALFHKLAEQLADKLKTRTQPFFLAILLGALLAIARRRTITKWIQAAQISDDFRQVFYHMPNIGRKSQELYNDMLNIILKQLRPIIETATSIRLVLDDTPTKRYGRKVEGAGYHHNPTPGKTDAKTCFGHNWVVVALVVTHPLFGEISFPIAAELYLRKKEIEKLQEKYTRTFKTKTTLAVELITRLVPVFSGHGKKIEVIVDGAYAKETALVPLGKLDGVTMITRLRRDAALFEIPLPEKRRGRGRPKVYGMKIDVKSMVASEKDWEVVECSLYGQVVSKRVKSFIATTKLTKGAPVRVILVKESDDTWVPLLSTDVSLGVVAILERYGVRFGIEEMFKDLKEVWCWGKQELRLLESNEAATAMNMLLYCLTELSTWDRSHGELVDRSYRPWDDIDRRPSHLDRRDFLRRGMLAKEFKDVMLGDSMPKKIITTLKRMILMVT